MNSRVGAIILAAGASSRLGRPKQLLAYQNTTLLQHAIDTATGAGCCPVVVILGAYADLIAQSFLQVKVYSMECAELYASTHHTSKQSDPETRVIFVYNPRWTEGQSTSLFVGVTALAKTTVNGALIMVCDQPTVHTADLKKLIDGQVRSLVGIAASGYADTVGVPACFARARFEELLELNGDCGAKALLQKYSDALVSVAIPKATLDIDTPADIQALQNLGPRIIVPGF